MAQLLGVLEQGLIYSILALGVYITFKILDFPDMTVDSSFPLGAAVTALMISAGINPLWTLPASLLAGAAAGAVTGIIHVRFHVRDLLSGIIVMTGLYSVNLHIAGRANVQLFSFQTLFKNEFIAGLPSGIQPYAPVILMALISLVVKLLMDAYLSTRSGFLLRATGDNPTLVASLAKDSGKVKILGLAIANALVALSGCIMCQYQRYFDISMGTGTLVLAVASVIVGTQLLRGLRFLRATTAVVLGSILYKGCVGPRAELWSVPIRPETGHGSVAVCHHRRRRSSKEGEASCLSFATSSNSIRAERLTRLVCLTISPFPFRRSNSSASSAPMVQRQDLAAQHHLRLHSRWTKGSILIGGRGHHARCPNTERSPPHRPRLSGPRRAAPARTMTILENMAMADNKGKPFNLHPWRQPQKDAMEYYRAHA